MNVIGRAYFNYNYYVKVSGEEFEFVDLFETLKSIAESATKITCSRMTKALMKAGVVTGPGRRGSHGAGKGPNFDVFLASMEKREDKVFDGAYQITKGSIRKTMLKLTELGMAQADRYPGRMEEAGV